MASSLLISQQQALSAEEALPDGLRELSVDDVDPDLPHALRRRREQDAPLFGGKLDSAIIIIIAATRGALGGELDVKVVVDVPNGVCESVRRGTAPCHRPGPAARGRRRHGLFAPEPWIGEEVQGVVHRGEARRPEPPEELLRRVPEALRRLESTYVGKEEARPHNMARG